MTAARPSPSITYIVDLGPTFACNNSIYIAHTYVRYAYMDVILYKFGLLLAIFCLLQVGPESPPALSLHLPNLLSSGPGRWQTRDVNTGAKHIKSSVRIWGYIYAAKTNKQKKRGGGKRRDM
jgi:hypothetical protein